MTAALPDWHYDDLRQVGLDFGDEGEVASYDSRQGTDLSEDRELLLTLGLEPEHVVADIGCGTGLLVAAAAQLCRRAHAVDASRAMLAATRARAKSLSLTNVETHHASFLSLDLAPASIDLVTSKFALHHLPDLWKGVALTRLRDLLKPGGRLFIRDVVLNCQPDELPAVAEAWIAWMGANTGYTRAETATHLREEHSTYGWIMERLIAEAGFELVSVQYESPVYADYLAVRP
ncbi:MAG: class I SAM-dependent methyltransferase [Hyphomicrobiaceae bacterium]